MDVWVLTERGQSVVKTIPGCHQNNDGLYQRYDVKKRYPTKDGEDSPKAMYFVLRLDAEGDDKEHIEACQAAALEFARRTNNRQLAEDLIRIVAEQAGLLRIKNIMTDIDNF